MLPTTSRLNSLLLILLVGAGCGSDDPTDVITPKAHSILIAPINGLTLSLGETGIASSVVRDENGDVMDAALTWTSSDPAVATVRAATLNNGTIVPGTEEVRAVSVGTATITAKCCGSLQASVDVTVQGAAWVLDSISGATTGNWQDQNGTASATIDFHPQTTVYEGESYVLLWKTIGTIMPSSSGGGAYITTAVTNRGLPAFHYDNQRSFGGVRVAGTPQTDSVSVTATWPIPTGATTVGVQIDASIQNEGQAPTNGALRLVAYYHKVSP